jgi:hypothetical protein
MGVLCRAWVNFGWNGSSVIVHKSFNVTSVVRLAQGEYSLTFTNAMTDAFYAVSATVTTNTSQVLFGAVYSLTIGGPAGQKTATNLTVVATGSGGNTDASDFSVIIFD